MRRLIFLVLECGRNVWRPYCQRPVSCSWMGWETPAASSSSVSWTPLTAWASVALRTPTPAVICSSLPTSMSYRTLWRFPRQRSSCYYLLNRWGSIQSRNIWLAILYLPVRGRGCLRATTDHIIFAICAINVVVLCWCMVFWKEFYQTADV